MTNPTATIEKANTMAIKKGSLIRRRRFGAAASNVSRSNSSELCAAGFAGAG
jgi:hypothetical protein